MKARIFPSAINGELTAPASKSGMQRALAAALLHTGKTTIRNAGNSNDDHAALNIIGALGAKVQMNDGVCEIYSSGMLDNIPSLQTINCGESGLAVRMFAPIAAISGDEINITGEGSLLRRPMHFFDEIFPHLGITIRSANGRLPIKIKGPLQPRNIDIDGSLSSQFLTGLLLAFGATTTETVVITVDDLKSKPYIDLTLDVMKRFGYDIIQDQYKQFLIHPKKQNKEPIIYTVEGDWSSASFLLVAGAISGNIKISGLDIYSAQADRKILAVLKDCGADIHISKDYIEIKKTNLKSFSFNATDCPDLFPPLAVLAAYGNGISQIKGVSRLAAKESNRAKALQDVLGKMGVEITLTEDEMTIFGGSVTGGIISSHYDHRIAMAAAVAALGAGSELLIENAEAVNKSYPAFFKDMENLGASIDIIESYI